MRRARSAPFSISFTKNLYLIIDEVNMIILYKNQVNELAMNINNNSREVFTGYTFHFVHVMSQEEKDYLIDVNNPAQFAENIRYCEVVLDFTCANCDLNYEGQYQLTIFGNGTTLVFIGMAELRGLQEEPLFTTYVSDNEDNSNYIYIE